MKRNIIIYDNRTGIAERMEPLFQTEGITMLVASSEEKIEALFAETAICLLLIDAELSEQGEGGVLAFLERLRKTYKFPIVIFSTQEAECAKIAALRAGADDYVTGSCSLGELLARMKAHLERYVQLMNLYENIKSIYKVDELEIDDTRRTVYVEGREAKLTPIEYKILRLLVQQKGKVFSINQIYEEIWQMKPVGVDNTIAVHIRHIREKIETDPRKPKYLKVVWGTGYRVG